MTSIVAISSCFPNVAGKYDGAITYPNLFLFIAAHASAGKGKLVHIKKLIYPIHEYLRRESKERKQQYEIDLAAYNAKKKEEIVSKPEKPPEKYLFIPANNSATGMFQLLSDSDGRGLIFETEGDTITQALNSEHGNYSDGLRKGFHNEPITYYRRTDREYVEIPNPKLSVILSGTPGQVFDLIPSSENGLFSRFCFFNMKLHLEWKNVFENEYQDLSTYFDELGNVFYKFHKELSLKQNISFSFTIAQKQKFHEFFKSKHNKYIKMIGKEFIPTVRRMGLIAFRICMIFSTIRLMEKGITSKIKCDDRDFNNALSIADVLLHHAHQIFSKLPKVHWKRTKVNTQREKFYDKLPETFNRKKYVEIAKMLSIPDGTAQGYIEHFIEDDLIVREKYNNYRKILL